MKKLTLVLALLVSFGLVGAFAQTVAPVVDFSAEAEAVFGIDLNDEMSTGFTNSAEADLKITWVNDETWENEGDGVYGWIQIEEINFAAAIDENTDVAYDDTASIPAQENWDASIGDINARVYFSPMYLEISTAPGFDFENAEMVRVDNSGDEDPDPAPSMVGYSDILATNGGVTVGFEGLADMMDVAFKVGSSETYDKDYNQVTGDPQEADVNDRQDYAFGLDVSASPMDMLSVDLGLVFTNANENKRTAKFGATLNPVLTLDVMSSLVVALPVDVAFMDEIVGVLDESISIDFAPEATLNLNEAGSNFMAKAYMAMNTEADGNLYLDAQVGFEEVEAGFVPGLASHLYFYLFDILDTEDGATANDMGYGANFGLSYNMNGIKPYADVVYYFAPDALYAAGLEEMYTIIKEDGIGSDFLNLSVGVELALIESTTFDINYSSVNLTNENAAGDIDAGRVTFSATVAY